jgi:hypothetical protein
MKTFLAIVILMGTSQKIKVEIIVATINWSKLQFLVRLWPQMNLCEFGILTLQWQFHSGYWSRLILDSLFEKIRKCYKPPQKLSFDEAMIPWRGRLGFRACNTGTYDACSHYRLYWKYGNVYCRGQKVVRDLFSLLETYLHLRHDVYQDNNYNTSSVKIAEKLPLRKPRGCLRIRANRGHSRVIGWLLWKLLYRRGRSSAHLEGWEGGSHV